VTSNFGGGHVLWVFQGSKLTLLQTYKGGGLATTFTFSRASGGGLQCAVHVGFARESSLPIGIGHRRSQVAMAIPT
jgi:hypothetical protein